MCGYPFEMGVNIENYESEMLPFVGNLFKKPRQRMYGVLFYEKPGALNKDLTEFEMSVEEWVCTGYGSLDEAVFVKPIIPPDGSHPGIENLWKNRDDRKFQGIQSLSGNLFTHCHLQEIYTCPKKERVIYIFIKL